MAIHGVAGGIKVKAHSGDPTGLIGARTLRLAGKPAGSGPEGRGRSCASMRTRHAADHGSEFRVKAARRSGGCAVFLLEGMDSAFAAEESVGSRVFMLRDELPPLEEGEFFVAELVGCAVEALDAERIGTVADVLEGPAHDWLAIRRGGKGGEVLLPLVSQFVREVDARGRRIVVTPPDGWPDED